MKNLLVKSAIMAMAFLCQFGNESEIEYYLEADSGGHIVVEGDNLISQTDRPDNYINSIYLAGEENSIEIDGCGKSYCVNSISNLDCGYYIATVVCTNGTFSDEVFICVE